MPQADVRGFGPGKYGDAGAAPKKVVTPVAKRNAVRFMASQHRLSVTGACRCVALSRSAYYNRPLDWGVRDADVRAALSKLIENRPSRGFWKCYKQLRRQGRNWN